MGLVELLQHPSVVRLHRAERLLRLLVPLLEDTRALPGRFDLSLKLAGAEGGGDIVVARILGNYGCLLLALEVNLERSDESFRVAQLLPEVRDLTRLLAKVGHLRCVSRGGGCGNLQP